MKAVCIYHLVDLDGWMSAAIVKHWFETQVEHENKFFSSTNLNHTINFIGCDYGQPIPDLSKYDKVIMCDISFPREKMADLWHNLDMQVIWIDHHVSAIKDNSSLVWEGMQDTSFAACELTWKYFFPNQDMPEIVRLLGRYDCFGHKGTDEEQKVLEFQYGARQVINNYEEAYDYLIKTLKIPDIRDRENVVKIIHAEGRSIYRYLCKEAEQVYKNRFDVTFFEEDDNKTIGEQAKKFALINRDRFNPVNFGIDYHKDGYDGIGCFSFDGERWRFSLYNDNGLVDVSKIAKTFGGGGHKGAAGFILNMTEFNRFINYHKFI